VKDHQNTKKELDTFVKELTGTTDEQERLDIESKKLDIEMRKFDVERMKLSNKSTELEPKVLEQEIVRRNIEVLCSVWKSLFNAGAMSPDLADRDETSKIIVSKIKEHIAKLSV
jgi:predicted nuclease with TOPRIM domain